MANQIKGDQLVRGHSRSRSFSYESLTITTALNDIQQLSSPSPSNIFFVGSALSQYVNLGSADTYEKGHQYNFMNDSTENVIIRDFQLNVLSVLGPSAGVSILCEDNVTPQGVWFILNTEIAKNLTWGRSGAVTKGTWLTNEFVPSNVSGRSVFIPNAFIKKISIAHQDPDIVKYEVYHHLGDGLAMTLIGSVTTNAVRTYETDFNLSVPKDVQLAIRIALDSPNGAKNPVVGVLLTGTLI